MLVDIKRLFDNFYKKNKMLTVYLIVFLLVVLGNTLGVIVKRTSVKINYTKGVVDINSSKIDGIEKRVDEQGEFIKDVVKHNSFNNYIKRKDAEYHQQMDINNSLFSKMGLLEGKFSMFSGLTKQFDLPENINNEIDRE